MEGILYVRAIDPAHLRAIDPAHLSYYARSKTEKGKAVSYTLRQDETIAEGILRVAREQLDGAIEALREDMAEDPVGAVHSTRKAIKKERALLRLARGTLPSGQRSADNRQLRDVGRTLSGLRDADVMIQTVERLSERFAGQLPASAFGDVRDSLSRSGAARRAGEDPGELAQAAINELSELRIRTDDWVIRDEGWSAIQGGLRRTYKQGRKALGKAQADPSAELLHEWRKRVKDHWYHLRLLTGVCGPIVAGAADEADRLSDVLGDDHDLAVLRTVLGEGSLDTTGVAGDSLLPLIDHRREELQAEAWKIGRRLFAEKPRRFERRVRRLWKAGQMPRNLQTKLG